MKRSTPQERRRQSLMITRTINVIRRYIFYLILGGLGLVSSLLQWVLVAPHLLCNATITWLFGAMDRLPNLDAHRQLCYFYVYEFVGTNRQNVCMVYHCYIGIHWGESLVYSETPHHESHRHSC